MIVNVAHSAPAPRDTCIEDFKSKFEGENVESEVKDIEINPPASAKKRVSPPAEDDDVISESLPGQSPTQKPLERTLPLRTS